MEDCEQNLTPRLRWLLDRLWQEWKQTEIDIKTVTDEIERIGAEDERCRRLRQIPGFGPLVATAMVPAIGNGAAFRRPYSLAVFILTKGRTDLREFLWQHWHGHSKGIAEASVGTVDAGRVTALYVVQPDAQGHLSNRRGTLPVVAGIVTVWPMLPDRSLGC